MASPSAWSRRPGCHRLNCGKGRSAGRTRFSKPEVRCTAQFRPARPRSHATRPYQPQQRSPSPPLTPQQQGSGPLACVPDLDQVRDARAAPRPPAAAPRPRLSTWRPTTAPTHAPAPSTDGRGPAQAIPEPIHQAATMHPTSPTASPAPTNLFGTHEVSLHACVTSALTWQAGTTCPCQTLGPPT